MRLASDSDAALWLRDFIADPESFDWDEGNRYKNTKHGVSCKEIEEIFIQAKILFAGKIVEPAHAEWRGLVLGQSAEGRLLALVFTRRGDKLRPISCRPMRPGERRIYEASIKESP